MLLYLSPSGQKLSGRFLWIPLRGWGRRQIVKKLNKNKVPAFQSKNGWQESYIAKVLQNKAVIGEFHTDKTETGEPLIVEDYFPAIIDEGLFYRAQAARDSRKKNCWPSRKIEAFHSQGNG